MSGKPPLAPISSQTLAPLDPSLSKKKKKKKSKKSNMQLSRSMSEHTGKIDVQALLTRALSSTSLTDTITVSEDRLHLALEKPGDDSSYNSEEDSVHYGSPRRARLAALAFPQPTDRSISVSSLGSPKGWDSFSLNSEVSSCSRLTNKELIHEINRRALLNKAPPDFVPALKSLDPSLISWNKQIPTDKRDDPPINIIGCMHPLELVLAKADKRMRKQTKAVKLKQIKCEERVKEIDDSIKWKFSRAERYAAAMALKQLQLQWLRVIAFTRFMKEISSRYFRSLQSEKQFMKVMRSTVVIQRFFVNWYRHRLFCKLQLDYERAFRKIESVLRFRIRIILKRRAVRRMRQFLTDFKGHHKMNVIVHRYLTGVRSVQFRMREFIVCKNAKITAMEKVWIKLEMHYIRKKLDQKKQRMKNLQVAKKNNDALLADFGGKSFIEMKQQAKLWSRIDGRMDAMVTTLKTTGMLKEESEEDVVMKLMVPEEMRKTALRAYLERTRKEFYLMHRNAMRKQIELDATFKEHHASQLLRGHHDNLNRIIDERYGKQIIKLKYVPFYFFSMMDRKVIFDKMKEAHQIVGTFKIKIAEHL